MHDASAGAEPGASDRSAGGLLRVLGVAFGLAVVVGNAIGVGILRTPGEVARQLPSTGPFLLVWLIGGAYALLGAISLSELSTMIPRSGGQYVFVRRALGAYPGFVVGWSDWISTCGSTAAMAMVLAEYLGPLVPVLAGYEIAVAIAVVLFFVALQWRGIRTGEAATQLTSLLKTVALLGLVVAILAVGSRTPAAPGAGPALPSGFGLFVGFVISFQAVIFTFDGWTGAIYFGEEVRDSARNIPRATIGGVLVLLAIYVALNIAFLVAVPIDRMAGDPFVAATAAQNVFGPRGDTVLRLLMIISLLAAVNANVLIASRVPLAMSRDGLLPRVITRVNEGGAPVPSLVAGAIVVIAFIATNSFDSVLALLAFFFVANYALSFASVFVLRVREPDAPRPYRAFGFPYTTGIALVGSVAFLVAAVVGDRQNSLRALLLLAVSIPAFLVSRGKRAD